MPAPIESLTEARPLDRHNRQLVANVHPQDWRNPAPRKRYHMVVIGAGTAGLITAIGAAGLGARVALIERRLMGGDCLNAGCVPSKALIRAAGVAAAVKGVAEFGVRLAPEAAAVDFGAVMERMRRLRAAISVHDSARRCSDLGIDVFLGKAEFTARRRVRVGEASFEFATACVATGTRAAVPPVRGLAEARPLTNESVFTLTELPARLAVIGGGPIGVEMAQAFARFGSQVTLVEREERILPRDDREAAEAVAGALRRDGVRLELRSAVASVAVEGDEAVLTVQPIGGGAGKPVRADRVLVAAGRKPNVEDLGLDRAGVGYDPGTGVVVDDRLRTSNRRIYAAGDVCSAIRFTHMADAMARIVVGNALFFGRSKAGALRVPWCIYSDPPLAHLGLSESDADRDGIPIDTYRTDMASVDRAVLDGQSEGFVKIHCKRGTDSILGATIVARHAGEMISEVSLAMTAGLGLKAVAGTIHPYPTHAEAIRKTALAYQRTRLTPAVRRLLGAILRLRG